MDGHNAPDIETSSDEYASRFVGPIGEWMLRVQEKIVLEMLADLGRATVLDVGGGHGQLALPLCERSFSVTVSGSDEICRKRIAQAVERGQCRFLVGDMKDLPFRDREFDVVISFRLLAHSERWDLLIAELCRLARKAVIVDFPTGQGLQRLNRMTRIAPMLFTAKRKLETNTRPWIAFRPGDVRDVFARGGFSATRMEKQFFLPMVLHRALRSCSVSVAVERLFRACGATQAWGSPVILKAERRSPD